MADFIITRKKNKLLTGAFIEDRLTDLRAYDEASGYRVGDIYVGRISNIVKNINAAFVNISKDLECYLDLSACSNAVFVKKQSPKKISMGDELIVAIEKEGIKTKAPVVTTSFSLSGKYVSICHGSKGVHVSKKITGKAEKDRLTDIFADYDLCDAGIIIRTNASGIDAEIIKKEADTQLAFYKELCDKAPYYTPFTLIKKSDPEYILAIRDTNTYKIDKIVTDCKDIKEDLKAFDITDKPEISFLSEVELNTIYKVDRHINMALRKIVLLKSGASLYIEQTESLTAIDVNTGKAIAGKNNIQETFFKINMEACKEIAFQMRARNLSGIIIVDFINMEDDAMKDKLLQTLREEFKKDPVKAEVVDITKLGLVEITRKKVFKPLSQQLGENF